MTWSEWELNGQSIRYGVGDVFDRLADIPDASVDLVLTSPPFLAVRSYLPDDHPDKAKEGGVQSSPGEFVDWLIDVVEACARVLAPHGSLCVELADTFSGSGGSGGDYNPGGLREGQPKFTGSNTLRRSTSGGLWPAAKSLALVPELFRVALAYGRNPLTGRETDPWIVRNVVRWVRPNPSVGALSDKFRPATSEMVVACKSRDRWFDLEAVRGEPNPDNERGTVANHGESDRSTIRKATGAPPYDWWCIPPGGYKGAHYAVWPPELCRVPILAMCPGEVCTGCGEPRRRLTQTVYVEQPDRDLRDDDARRYGSIDGNRHNDPRATERVTTGWTVCGCESPTYRPGVVLDPFAGSGTTLGVAAHLGRSAIGTDIDERNAVLARDRTASIPAVFARADDTRLKERRVGELQRQVESLKNQLAAVTGETPDGQMSMLGPDPR